MSRCVACGYSVGVADAVEPPDDLEALVQQVLGDSFHIQARLGRSARSGVFLVTPRGEGRLKVLKVVPVLSGEGAAVGARFRADARRWASLSHPHVIPVLEFGDSDTLLWYTMEHISGRSLRDLLAGGEPLDLATCMRVVNDVASALDYAHRRGMVHGNLKPSNILVDDRGWSRVADFGLRQSMAAASGRAEDLVASAPMYVAPEQLVSHRRTSAASDQYALGVVAFECLAGRVAFPGHEGAPAPQNLLSQLSGLAERRPGIGPHVAEVLTRALSPHPGARFASVLDFATLLEDESPAVPLPGPPIDVSARPTPARMEVLRPDAWEEPVMPRRRRLVYSAVGVLVLSVAASIWLGSRRSPGVVADLGLFEEGFPRFESGSARLGESTAVALPVEDSILPEFVFRPRSSEQVRDVPRRVPSAPGQLFVSATPWGQLYVDDSLLGNTPRANVSVPPGRRRIRVVREGFTPFDSVIVVRSGEEVRLTGIVLVPRNP